MIRLYYASSQHNNPVAQYIMYDVLIINNYLFNRGREPLIRTRGV